jgi:hypothetical protein
VNSWTLSLDPTRALRATVGGPDFLISAGTGHLGQSSRTPSTLRTTGQLRPRPGKPGGHRSAGSGGPYMVVVSEVGGLGRCLVAPLRRELLHHPASHPGPKVIGGVSPEIRRARSGSTTGPSARPGPRASPSPSWPMALPPALSQRAYKPSPTASGPPKCRASSTAGPRPSPPPPRTAAGYF